MRVTMPRWVGAGSHTIRPGPALARRRTMSSPKKSARTHRTDMPLRRTPNDADHRLADERPPDAETDCLRLVSRAVMEKYHTVPETTLANQL